MVEFHRQESTFIAFVRLDEFSVHRAHSLDYNSFKIEVRVRNSAIHIPLGLIIGKK